MNFIAQIKDFLDGNNKLVVSIFIASFFALVIERYFPEEFDGLPQWVFPAIRLAVILTAALILVRLMGPLWKLLRRATWKVFAPVRKSCIRKSLLGLTPIELICLCRALAKRDRNMELNADDPVVILLSDKQLIAPGWGGASFITGRTSFNIPVEVWREMLSMEEFRLRDPVALRWIPMSDPSELDNLISLLPELHPTVQKLKKK